MSLAGLVLLILAGALVATALQPGNNNSNDAPLLLVVT